MTIKEIVLNSAVMLGRENAVKYLEASEQAEGDTLAVVNNLTRCANLVINELSGGYIPMLKSEKATVNEGKLFFASLSERVVEITAVYDEYGQPVTYEYFPEYLAVRSGKVTVVYRYVPCVYGIDDTVGYSERDIPARIIAYGVCAEYCLTIRDFDESVMWRNRFTDALRIFLIPKSTRLKRREWA